MPKRIFSMHKEWGKIIYVTGKNIKTKICNLYILLIKTDFTDRKITFSKLTK